MKFNRWEWGFIILLSHFAAAAKSLQSCPTLCDPIDGSPPGSPVPGILQARTLEWVAISFSNAWKWKVKVKSLSRVWLLTTPWTAAYQAPPSMGFSRQEYWSGVPELLIEWLKWKRIQVLGRTWRDWHSCILIHHLKNCLAVPADTDPYSRTQKFLSSDYPNRNAHICTPKDMYISAHSTICNR